jgi:hypothetical protein
LTFYNSDQLAISQQLLTSLTENYSARILSLVNDQPAVAFPLQVFHFGSDTLMEAVNAILASKIQLESEANYYTAKFAWRKLFKAELPSQKGEKTKAEELTALAKRLVEEAKYFYKKRAAVEPAPSPTIDRLFSKE